MVDGEPVAVDSMVVIVTVAATRDEVNSSKEYLFSESSIKDAGLHVNY